MHVLYMLISMLLLLGSTHADCPHDREGLQKWSEAGTWETDGKPTAGDSIEISLNVILDESPPDMGNITILPGASLTFNPNVSLELRVANIFVQGALEIGSEDCLYDGSLTITLTGTREEHQNEENAKAIVVEAGGVLELHGEPRLSWTKLNRTLALPTAIDGVKFEHKYNDEYNSFVDPGIIAYTFSINGTEVTVKDFGLYNLRRDSQILAEHINRSVDGDVIMMAAQQKVVIKSPDQQKTMAFEAIEILVSGSITGSCILRTALPEGDTWAFVMKKGDPGSYKEVTQPSGTSSVVQYIDPDDLIFTAASIGKPIFRDQIANFRVANSNAEYQMVELIDDVTTWRAGDKVVVASTDYDWRQAEVRDVVFCPDCNNFQIRLSEPVKFTHYGKVLYNAHDMRAEVALLSRKVVIQGEMQEECPEFNGNCQMEAVEGKDTFGGHITILRGFGNVHIENIELYHMGQQTDLGRYPVHFHMCLGREGEQVDPYVKGCSIHDTFARCVTIHATHHILVMDNACYNHMGHGYFLEDGGEMNNTFDGNLALTTRKGTGHLEPSDSDLPASFWITNPRTYARNNVAAGGEGFGIWHIYPPQPFTPSRELNLMEYFEARKTNILEFTNNVAHSNDFFGVKIGGRLLEDRTTFCCNNWRPVEDPMDNSTAPVPVHVSFLTGYKNSKYNLWIEGSLLQCTRFSVSDSLNGIIVSNERLIPLAGRLDFSVILGDTENIGEPAEGFHRSLPAFKPEKPHSGIQNWRGPVQYNHNWFNDFKPNNVYDIAAIAKQRGDRYYYTITTPFRDSQFAFDDAEGVGTITISGTKNDTGWEGNNDAEQVSGFTWYRNTSEGIERLFVVKPDPLSAAAKDCRLRPHWRLALCTTKYGNVRVQGDFFKHGALGVYVRDEYPGAQLTFELEKPGGPQVVFDGSQTYTFHTVGKVQKEMEFVGEGLEIGDTLRIGVCLPLKADFTLRSTFPFKLKTMDKFVKVDSLADLDAKDNETDGKKYYYDSTTGMLYYKFIGTTNRYVGENQICGGGKCPFIEITLSGDISGGADCREGLYGSRLSLLPPPIKTDTETIKANGSPEPPEGYGAGPQRPFSSRSPVNGKYGPWSDWSDCSVTCGDGMKYRTRECNNPLPQHGGGGCSNARIRSRRCRLDNCPT